MNSLVNIFSNFKEFYSEINGATLTGAIDVIIVEQPDGTFLCSPFHVRFGKLGVLRSREKIVDIEVNGEPVDIHMKLGESGEAFFVEECLEEDLPANMATSPLPIGDFSKYMNDEIFINNDDDIQMPRPRRNSIDLSKESEENEKQFDNQISDFSHRRHTDNTMERRDLSTAKLEFTTQKIRQEWKDHEDQILGNGVDGQPSTDWQTTSTLSNITDVDEAIVPPGKNITDEILSAMKEDAIVPNTIDAGINSNNKDETKSKKKRRKKSMMKKKTSQRKSSSSSSIGSGQSDAIDGENESSTSNTNGMTETSSIADDLTKLDNIIDVSSSSVKIVEFEEKDATTEIATINKIDALPPLPQHHSQPRLRDLDIHFFSDTELASGKSPHASRPQTPIQSDSEYEMSNRDRDHNTDKNDIMTNSASWKWGELPTQETIVHHHNFDTEDAKQAQRNSMLSNMFSFMKQSKKLRKTSSEGGVYLSDLDAEGMDPKMMDLYFPPIKSSSSSGAGGAGSGADTAANINDREDDVESGNGTSLPHSPSSLEEPKSLDSDYDEDKSTDNKYLDFVSMSLCGGLENGGPTDEEFSRGVVQYSEVCQNPSIFSSPTLVVRLNGKYYSWAAACPIVMTIITYQKPLTNDAIEQLMNVNKPSQATSSSGSNSNNNVPEAKRGYSSWWYWRRSGDKQHQKSQSINAKDVRESDIVAEQQSIGVLESNTDQIARNKKSKEIDVKPNKEMDSKQHDMSSEHLEYNRSISISDDVKSNELYRKSLRLTTDQIASLNLKNGINEISFSVTTAYQGTSRCKCYLFRWKHSDKVVISDIDGTITKSDVLGHILPMVGRDWAQIGVAQLFSKIEENGYKLLYLSARAIGQSRVTREYLRSIRQGDVKLPDGPLLLNPTSLISAFHREVIEKKPEQFKIACLSDIQALFPQKNPFYAGYGNRINDVWAYRAVGIPIMRIFTINPKGELKHELTQTFQSTYCNMTYIVDQVFPPMNDIEESIEYTNFNYWRDPVIDIEYLDPLNASDTAMNVTAAATPSSSTTLMLSKQLPAIPEK